MIDFLVFVLFKSVLSCQNRGCKVHLRIDIFGHALHGALASVFSSNPTKRMSRMRYGVKSRVPTLYEDA